MTIDQTPELSTATEPTTDAATQTPVGTAPAATSGAPDEATNLAEPGAGAEGTATSDTVEPADAEATGDPELEDEEL